MNLNALILTNIQSASYFKQNLFKLKTYHEVIDEIYYQVKHMEPWEKGSRKSGQTGMCGGVGIVFSASRRYILLVPFVALLIKNPSSLSKLISGPRSRRRRNRFLGLLSALQVVHFETDSKATQRTVDPH